MANVYQLSTFYPLLNGPDLLSSKTKPRPCPLPAFVVVEQDCIIFFSKYTLIPLLLIARGVIAGVFQAAYLYTPEVSRTKIVLTGLFWFVTP